MTLMGLVKTYASFVFLDTVITRLRASRLMTAVYVP